MALVTQVSQLLIELYSFIDDAFIDYFISLPAPQAWRSHLIQYEQELGNTHSAAGLSSRDIERQVDQQPHIFIEGEFRLQTTLASLKRNLIPGRWENIQAQRAIRIIYDEWESHYRIELHKLLGIPIEGDIWGDLRYIRQSLTHHRCIGINKLAKVKIIKDFKPGRAMIFTPSIMEKIRQELENWYTGFQLQVFSPQKILQ